MTKHVAIILSGCGAEDGSEIIETTLSLLTLEAVNVQYTMFAPHMPFKEINHITGEETGATRDALTEAARLARGKVENLNQLHMENFDGLLIPGGCGAVRNLSNIASGGRHILPALQHAIEECYNAKKPMLGICVAPAVIVSALNAINANVTVTIGKDENNLIETLGGRNVPMEATEYYYDEPNNIISTPAYIDDCQTPILSVQQGIQGAVQMLFSAMENGTIGQDCKVSQNIT